MINQRKIGFVLSYFSIFVSSIIGIAFTPYMITSLGKDEYGLYQVLHSFIGYFALLDFGLGSTLTRFILKYKSANDKESINSVVTISIKLYSTIGLVTLLLSACATFFLDEIFVGTINSENLLQAKLLLLVMGLTTAISFIRHAITGIFSANEQYIVMKGDVIIQHVLRVILIYSFLKMGMKAVSVAFADLIIVLTLLIFDFLYCKVRLKYRLLAGRWDKGLFKSLISFSFFVFLQIIVVQVNNGLDRVLLGRYSTLAIVALYGVAMQLYSLFNSFGGVISNLTLPKISKVVFSGAGVKETTESCIHYSRYQLHILAPLLGGFIVLGKHFISLWTPEYDATQVYGIVLLIVAPQILESVEGTIFNVMKAKNLQATRSCILAAVMIGNIILTIFLIKFMPIYGAALGTFISFVLGNTILSNIYYHKKVGVNMFLYFRKLFKGILPVFIIAVIIGFVINKIPLGSWFGFIIKGLIFVLAYGILIYLFGLNSSEKEMVNGILNKIKNKIRRKSYVG